MADFFTNLVSSVPCGTWYFTFTVVLRMWVTSIKKNKIVKIRSGKEAVLSSGILRLRRR